MFAAGRSLSSCDGNRTVVSQQTDDGCVGKAVSGGVSIWGALQRDESEGLRHVPAVSEVKPVDIVEGFETVEKTAFVVLHTDGRSLACGERLGRRRG